MITCCKNCNKRKTYCHTTCETYIKQKAEHDVERIANQKKKYFEKNNRLRVYYAIKNKENQKERYV